MPRNDLDVWDILMLVNRAGNIGIVVAECMVILMRAPGAMTNSDLKVFLRAIVGWMLLNLVAGTGLMLARLCRRKWGNE